MSSGRDDVTWPKRTHRVCPLTTVIINPCPVFLRSFDLGDLKVLGDAQRGKHASQESSESERC